MNIIKFLSLFFLLYSVLVDNVKAVQKYVIGHWSGGIGVCITSILNHLLHCERNNLIPVVYWNRSLYYNPHGFNGKHNEWEYYFNPVSNLHYQMGDPINYFCFNVQDCGKFSYYDPSDEKRNLAHNLMLKYISLNSIVQSKVDDFFIRNMLGKKTIGIHIRGTDKYTENRLVAPEVVISEALKYADNTTQFFIATDEKKIFNQMLKLLSPRPVIYYDCYRSEDGTPLHQPRKPPISQLGEDVVVEMWLMAKCDILIHTLSNVSSIPLYLNPELKHVTLR